MALSYCWGKAKFCTLRKHNLTRFKEGIRLSTLPKTFQDAVEITGWVQIRYLWIDSLCILQDCHDDWTRESCKMRDVYKNSLLTIAATGAVDPSIGCFRDREPKPSEALRFRAPGESGIDYIAVENGIIEESLCNTPLSRRGWILQERLLSSRVLHFGEKQMLWECHEFSACETYPDGVKVGTSRYSFAKKSLLVEDGENTFSHMWRAIVDTYTHCALTKSSDKCLAIAGIADEIQSRSGSSYVAGLWRQNLELELLWQVLNYSSDAIRQTGKRSATYVAPSWSWLSFDGQVYSARFWWVKEILLEIVDLEIELCDGSCFGPFKGGHLRARGMLSPATWQPETRNVRPAGSPLVGEILSIRGHSCIISGVRMDVATEAQRNVFCVPVAKAGYKIISGLVLAKTSKGRNEYRRIGMFIVDIDDFDLQKWDSRNGRRFFRLLQYRPYKRKWRRLPKTTFTIV